MKKQRSTNLNSGLLIALCAAAVIIAFVFFMVISGMPATTQAEETSPQAYFTAEQEKMISVLLSRYPVDYDCTVMEDQLNALWYSWDNGHAENKLFSVFATEDQPWLDMSLSEDILRQYATNVFNVTEEAIEAFKIQESQHEWDLGNDHYRGYENGRFYYGMHDEHRPYGHTIEILRVHPIGDQLELLCLDHATPNNYDGSAPQSPGYDVYRKVTIQIRSYNGQEYCSLYNAKDLSEAEVTAYGYTGTSAQPVSSVSNHETSANGLHVRVYNTFDEGLALKAQPDINSTRYLLIPDRTPLIIDSISGAWGHTTYNGLSGWVALRYTLITDANYPAQQPSHGRVSPFNLVVGGTEGEGLELRTKPSVECSSYGAAPDGTWVQVDAVEGEWVYTYYNGNYGWMNTTYLW